MVVSGRFPTVPLGEITKFINGDRGHNYPSPSEFVSEGIPFISAADLVDGQVVLSGAKRISEPVYERLGSGKVQLGDLLFCLRGSLGKMARMTALSQGAIASSLVIIRPTSQVDGRYLYYVLMSPLGQGLAGELDNGSVQPNISAQSLKNIQIPYPGSAEQRAIAHILGTLDDKIELNCQMNQTLEAMARAIFMSWFVDFDPVRAKAEGRDPGLPPDLAALFPDSFEESELGEIPKGWEVKKIEDIADRVAMGPFGSSIRVDTFVPEGVPVISGQHLRSFMLHDHDYNFVTHEHAERLKNANVYRGDVIFTHAGSIGQVAYIPENSQYESYVISQRQFYMRCNLSKVTPSFITCYFKTDEGQHKLLANTSSTGVPSISRPVTYLRSIELCIPPKKIIDEFDKVVQPMHIQIRSNINQSNNLATLRDALLPKLLSGEIWLQNVERFAESKNGSK